MHRIHCTWKPEKLTMIPRSLPARALVRFLLGVALLPAAACAIEAEAADNRTAAPAPAGPTTHTSAPGAAVVLDVYKSPSCGCCEVWIRHLEQQGFLTRTHHPADLDALKAKQGIPPEQQSCHTAVSAGGYVFEGHVPARFIRQFLANPPAHARGLAVPGMPIGSPGMESGDAFQPYQVMLLKDDGGPEVYATVSTPADQRAAEDVP